MYDQSDNGAGRWWVWFLVIFIIIILIACAFYAFNDDGQGCLLAPAQARNHVLAARSGNKVRFPPETVRASVRLSGDQEVPPVKTSGKGKGHVVVDPCDKAVYYDIYAKKLSSDVVGAHFHRGERGVNGPALKDLSIEESDDCRYYRFKGKWTPKDAKQPLTQRDLDDLLSGRVYVNVHTEKYSPGEIRGQVSC